MMESKFSIAASTNYVKDVSLGDFQIFQGNFRGVATNSGLEGPDSIGTFLYLKHKLGIRISSSC